MKEAGRLPSSAVTGIRWPALPGPPATTLLALEHQLERSEWWPSERLRAWQFHQLEPLLRHAYEVIPFYRERFRAVGFDPGVHSARDRWQELPLLTRDDLEDHGGALLAPRFPADHGKLMVSETSGSTGPALKVARTEATTAVRRALLLREHRWRGREFAGRLVAIASGWSDDDPLQVRDFSTWGEPLDALYSTGPATRFFHRMPLAQQADVLRARGPSHLVLYPSNLSDLTRHFRDRGLGLPELRDVRTYGEASAPEDRADCGDFWGVPVSDVYSAQEAGFIAVQCAGAERYHVQAESLLVEVLDAEGAPCGPGEIGQVVFTTLNNFAMPLIRYAIGDFAEVGEPCPCGRGLPVLNRILGRERNRVALPDGRRLWPELHARVWSDAAPIEEVQLVQRSLDRIEVRVAMARALDASEQSELTASLRAALHYPFRLSYERCDVIPRHPNGKRERFISEIPSSRSPSSSA